MNPILCSANQDLNTLFYCYIKIEKTTFKKASNGGMDSFYLISQQSG